MRLPRGRFLTPNPVATGWGKRDRTRSIIPQPFALFVFTPTGPYLTRVITLGFTVTANSEAATREIELVINDGDGVAVVKMGTGVTFAAKAIISAGIVNGAFGSGVTSNTGATVVLPIPPIEQGWSIEVRTSNAKEADAITSPVVWYEQFEAQVDRDPADIKHLAEQLHTLGEAAEYANY